MVWELDVWLVVVCVVLVVVLAPEEPGAAEAPAIPASAPVPASAVVMSAALTFVERIMCCNTSLIDLRDEVVPSMIEAAAKAAAIPRLGGG